MTMAKGENIDEGVDYKKAIEIFAQGVEAVKQRGKADVGEKTMMDVLIPVANCLQDGVQNNKDINEILSEAIQVAEKGMQSTKDLLATKGRASFLGERAKGHIDPGARSSQLMIKTVCESVIQKQEEQMKKFMNTADDFLKESLQGFGSAHQDIVSVYYDPNFITRSQPTKDGKVCLLYTSPSPRD